MKSSRSLLLFAVSMLAAACFSEPEAGEQSEQVAAPEMWAEASATTTLRVSVCGNATLDPDEDCDDGNRDDHDGCSTSCRFGPTWERCVGFVVAPAAPHVGQTVSLVVRPADSRVVELDYRWSSSGGELLDPTATDATFVCVRAGAYELSLSVPACPRTYQVRLSCSP